jgi:S-adenosylmethionine:tRNA ribosyltransferase-isomerase
LISFDNLIPELFDYELPKNRIADYPVGIRDDSRLLIKNKDNTFKQDIFKNLADHIPAKSHVFLNNSRVIPARLIFIKETGSTIEIFCIKPEDPSDYSQSLSSKETCIWECVIGNLKKFRTETISMKIETKGFSFILRATKILHKGNTVMIRFSWDNHDFTFGEILSVTGLTPLPPYIKRDPAELDRLRYQTIYSKHDGSVAAPTAGLHFTHHIFEELKKKNISSHEITLHVGAGTFQPIKEKSVLNHEMHSEIFRVPASIIHLLAGLNTRVVCVGTTTLRTLESLYWLGVKMIASNDFTGADLMVGQWEAYHLPGNYSLGQSFEALGCWLDKHDAGSITASTRLMIVPGYQFKTVNTLITNFHQPRSTLLLLVAAFIGDSWKELYQHAMNNDFRFLSYGDSSILFA